MFGFKKGKNRVYLDWAAGTPLLPEAKAAMEPFLTKYFANPSSIHQEGQTTRAAVEEARRQIAFSLQVKPEYVTFTGGGTEGNNLSLLGVVRSLENSGRGLDTMEIITTKIEHPSILKTVEFLAAKGVQVKYVETDEFGTVKTDSLQGLLSKRTVLVSVAYANSEIGVIQPLHKIKKIIKTAESKFDSKILLHVDAAQAPLWLPCQFSTVGADLLVLDAAKCCGPKGVGVLVRSQRVKILPIIFGGGQEEGLRSGTENVAGIVGAGMALEKAQADWKERSRKVSLVRDEAISLLLKIIPEVILNGPVGENRLANNINISLPGFDTEYAAVWLDKKGFAVSTKSACSGAGGGESVVVKHMTGDSDRAASTLRFSLGPDTTVKEIKDLADNLWEYKKVMSKLK